MGEINNMVSYVSYAFGILVSMLVVFMFGNWRFGEFSWSYFMLDIFFGIALAYNMGMVIEQLVLGFSSGKIRLGDTKTKN